MPRTDSFCDQLFQYLSCLLNCDVISHNVSLFEKAVPGFMINTLLVFFWVSLSLLRELHPDKQGTLGSEQMRC